MSVNHVVPCGKEHSIAELVALPFCGRAKMLKEVHIFCVVYKVQGKKCIWGFLKMSFLIIPGALKALL